jgi:polysaccharide biosynthesis transport protein
MSVSNFTPPRLMVPLHNAAGSTTFNPKTLLRGVRRHIHVVVGMLVLGTMLGYLVERSITPKYTSSVSILIDPKRPGTYGADATFANLYVDSNKISSVEVILVSSGLLGKVVRAENLAAIPEFGDPSPAILRTWLDLIPAWRVATLPDTQQMREERALERLTHAVKTARVGMTYVITVSVTASRPDLAQTLAQKVSEAYLNDQVEIKYAAAQNDIEWLSKRVEHLRGELIHSEQAVEAIRTKYNLTQTDGAPGSTVERQTITEINAQLAQAEGEIAARKARYDQALRVKQSGGSLDGLPEVEASKVVQSLRQQQADLNRSIAELTIHYTPNYPGRKRAEEDRNALNAQVAAEVSRIVDGMRVDAQAAVARRDALKRQLADLIRNADDGTSAEGRIQLREAERIADANRAVYDASLTHLREVQQQETRQEVEARIISAAFEPSSPSFPKPILFLGGGGVGGLMIGLGFAVLWPLMERRVVSAVTMEQTVSLPVLAMVPLLKRANLKVGAQRLTVVEYLGLRPLSLFAESLRSLRIGLRFGHDGMPHVIQVTSAVVGEGKSTIAASMAMSAAAAGVRTVLVDLDFYNPSVAKIFGLPQGKGVVDVLAGTAPSNHALQTHGELPLTIVSSGYSMQPRPDVLEGGRFKGFIDGLAKQFELVILDTPPVLAVSNPVATSRVADATVLTVAWRQTSQVDVIHAVEVLRAAGAPLAGIVLNKADLTQLGRYDGKRYRDGSY